MRPIKGTSAMTHQITMDNSGRMNVFQTALSGVNELENKWSKQTHKNLV